MRKLGIGTAVLAVILFILNITLYDKIFQVIPVIRGVEAEKSLFLSMRILIINILTLIAFLVLAKSISRSHEKRGLSTFGSWILFFFIAKMSLEFIGLFTKGVLEVQMYPLVLGIILLLLFGISRYRFLLSKGFWETVRFSATEKIILIFLLVAYIAVNIPAISVVVNR
jgi:hypothetical protein